MGHHVEDTPLGKDTDYPDAYDASQLFPIGRKEGRELLGLLEGAELPFRGVDYWNAYEVSWLNTRGKPAVGVIEVSIPCHSPNIVESKSLKLYLNSLNQHRFENSAQIVNTITVDLENIIGDMVDVKLHTQIDHEDSFSISVLKGESLDHLDIDIDQFNLDDTILRVEDNAELVTETLYSHLLRSNCPVTSQPDWASVIIRYTGPKLNREALLKYIISYRTHNEFHEQCVERMFMDINNQCGPSQLTVYARYTRRGGIDINPFRSNFEMPYSNSRLLRQ